MLTKPTSVRYAPTPKFSLLGEVSALKASEIPRIASGGACRRAQHADTGLDAARGSGQQLAAGTAGGTAAAACSSLRHCGRCALALCMKIRQMRHGGRARAREDHRRLEKEARMRRSHRVKHSTCYIHSRSHLRHIQKLADHCCASPLLGKRRRGMGCLTQVPGHQ
jgi:hypothetical protein